MLLPTQSGPGLGPARTNRPPGYSVAGQCGPSPGPTRGNRFL